MNWFKRKAMPFLVGAAVLYALWAVAVLVFRPPTYILPTPTAVFARFAATPLEIVRHTFVTVFEFSFGLLVGVATAFVAAILSVWSKRLDSILSPFAVMMQSVPKVGLAPLFVIWFGYGYAPKIVIAAMIAFFPIYMNLIGGMKAADQDLVDYAATLRMSRWKVIWKIQLPFAVPFFFAAMKMAAIYSVVGAIVGEFVGADKGLGYLIIQGDLNFDSPLLFVAIHILILIGVTLYLTIDFVETRMISWQPSRSHDVGYVTTA